MTSFSDILPCIVCNSLLLKGAPLLRYRTLLYLWIFGVSLYRLGWSYILLVHHQIRLSYRGDISHRFSYSPLYIVLLLVFIFFLPPLNYNFISLTSLKTSIIENLTSSFVVLIDKIIFSFLSPFYLYISSHIQGVSSR